LANTKPIAPLAAIHVKDADINRIQNALVSKINELIAALQSLQSQITKLQNP